MLKFGKTNEDEKNEFHEFAKKLKITFFRLEKILNVRFWIIRGTYLWGILSLSDLSRNLGGAGLAEGGLADFSPVLGLAMIPVLGLGGGTGDGEGAADISVGCDMFIMSVVSSSST